MCRADGEVGLSGDGLSSADVDGVEVGREGLGVYGQDVGRRGEGYGDAGWFGGDMRVVAVAMGESVVLQSFGDRSGGGSWGWVVGV